MLNNGDLYTLSFSFTQQDVNTFAEVTGDNNPIHLDENYASQTVFKRPIIHGFLGGSIFSRILGTLFPGQGSVYLKQSLEFLRPMYVNEEYEAVCTIKEVNREKNQALIETVVKQKQTGKVVIKGEAVVMNKAKI